MTRSLQAPVWYIDGGGEHKLPRKSPHQYRTKIWEAGFEFMGHIEDGGVKFNFGPLEFVKFPKDAVTWKR